VPDFGHCLGTNAINNSIIDIENTTHLNIVPHILKFITKDAEEGENLGIAGRSGIVGQAANNASCITRRQLFDEAGIHGISGRPWVDLRCYRLVLAGTLNGLSALHLLWGIFIDVV
jgi:hypothetical protein